MTVSTLLVQLLALQLCGAANIPRSPQGHQHGDSPAPSAGGPPPGSPFGKVASLLKGLPQNEVIPKLKSNLPHAKVFSTESTAGKQFPTAKRKYVRYGPYNLVGKGQPRPESWTKSLDPNGQAFAELFLTGLCYNCTVLAGKFVISFEDGTEAQPQHNVYLHHAITRDFSKPPNLPITECYEGQKKRGGGGVGDGASEFLAAGEDSRSGGGSVAFASKSKIDTGYFIGAEMALLTQLDFVNYNAEAKTVYVGLDLEYQDGQIGTDSASVLVSVTGCNDETAAGKSAINLDPKGLSVTESGKWVVSKDSRIVSMFGHMHDGGSAMSMSVNGNLVCKADAVYGKGGANNDETLKGMTACSENIVLKKGDYITMKAEYDLAKHPLREGAEHNSMGMEDVMGMFYMTFATPRS